MYLSVFDHAVSAVLLKDQGVQYLVYYISKTLVLALVHVTKKLSHYFQAYTVYVLTKYSLQLLLKRSDFMRRIAKWGTRLGAFDIRYKPRNSVKGQVLANFVTEFSPRNEGEMVYHVECHPWRVFMDSASSAMGANAGIVIITPERIRLEHSFRLGFKASNNEAKYEALLAGLNRVLGMGAWDVEAYSDSRLVVN